MRLVRATEFRVRAGFGFLRGVAGTSSMGISVGAYPILAGSPHETEPVEG